MQAVLWKIIAFILSLFMPFISIPIEIDPIIIGNDGIEIISNKSDGIHTEGQYVFETYEEFMAYYTVINSSKKMKDYSETIDKDFFKENNLVIVDVALSDPSCSVFVISAIENATELSLEFVIVSEPTVAACVICYDSVCIKTSKLIRDVEISSKEKINIPFMLSTSNYLCNIVEAERIDDAEEFDISPLVFKDFASWQTFLSSGEWNFREYTDEINEDYFENNNLGLVITCHANTAYETRIAEFDPYVKELNLTCYEISQPKVGLSMVCYEAVFIKVSKETEKINVTTVDYSIPFILDRAIPEYSGE